MNEMPIIKLAAEDNCAICKRVIGDGDVVYLCQTLKAHHRLFCRNCGLKTDMDSCGRYRQMMTRDMEHTHHIHEVKVENGKG